MPGYIKKALTRFQHKQPLQLQNSLHKDVPLTYGAPAQYAQQDSASPLLSRVDKTYVQAVTGTLLYYKWAIDSPIRTTLNVITTQQAAPM